MIAILFGLLGSFWFGFSMIFINRGLLAVDYFRGLLINLGVNSLFLWIYVLLSGDKIDLLVPANLIFVGIGIFVPGGARFFIIKGVQRLGASISSCLVNTTSLFAILMAIAFLGERPTPTNILGALSIVAGIVSLSWRGATKTWRTVDLVLPLSGALLFAARDNLARFGVLQIDAPVLGATITATTSFVTMALMYWGYGEKKPLPETALRGFTYFSAAGFVNFLSYVFIFTAFSLERVSLISPLVNSSSLFVLLLTPLFLKDVETLTARKVSATLLVILGVFLISWEKL
jgi:uncharacterized membrane protein